jgi:hypothetical protein
MNFKDIFVIIPHCFADNSNVIYFEQGWFRMIMDNEKQVKEITRYQRYLADVVGREIDKNIAARIWIRKYAKVWRLTHPFPLESEQQ